MKNWWLVVVVSIGLAGCAWDPKRDNPVDPTSPYYTPPPPRNRAPEVDTIVVRTHKQWSDVNPLYSFDLIARVSDPDGNLDFSNVQAQVSTFQLGPMTFDPVPGEFRLHRSQIDFPSEDLNQLIGTVVQISAHDDSAARDESSILFPTPLREPEPQILYPQGNPVEPVQIISDSVRLGWQLWSSAEGDHRFSVSVLYRNIFTDWDTVGLMPTDTFVVVTDSLLPASIDPSIYYTWYLTVTDGLGNTITSLPGYFRYFPSSEPAAAIKPDGLVSE